MTTTTQAAGVPDGAFVIAPKGPGVVVARGRVAVLPAISLSSASFRPSPAGSAFPAPQENSPDSRPGTGAGRRPVCRQAEGRRAPLPAPLLPEEKPAAAEGRLRRLPLSTSEPMNRFIPE
jgi:hypothetical protein